MPRIILPHARCMGTLRVVPYTCVEDRGIQLAVTKRLSHIFVLALPFDRLCMDLFIFFFNLLTISVSYHTKSDRFDGEMM